MIKVFTNEGVKEFTSEVEVHNWANGNFMLKDTSTGQVVETVVNGGEYVAIVRAKAAA